MEVIAEFRECPSCRVDARLMNSIVQEEIMRGKMGDDAYGSTHIEVYCNIDPKMPPLLGGRAPGARVFRDICTKCGREYITKIERGHITIPTAKGVPPVFS